MPARKTAEQALWEKVIIQPGCWGWNGATAPGGYGVLHRRGEKPQTIRASRLVWALTYGPIPDGLWVLHKCDNPACVRPDHLFLGTHKDNMVDMRKKCRQTSRVTHPLAKLSNEECEAIIASAEPSNKVLAANYDVSASTITRIRGVTRKTRRTDQNPHCAKPIERSGAGYRWHQRNNEKACARCLASRRLADQPNPQEEQDATTGVS